MDCKQLQAIRRTLERRTTASGHTLRFTLRGLTLYFQIDLLYPFDEEISVFLLRYRSGIQVTIARGVFSSPEHRWLYGAPRAGYNQNSSPLPLPRSTQ